MAKTKYIDVNGKVSHKGLRGNPVEIFDDDGNSIGFKTGRLYGNARMFSPEEIEEMLADGISEFTVGPQPASIGEDVRRRSIRGLTSSRINNHMMGQGNDGDLAIVDALFGIMSVQAHLYNDLKSKGLMNDADFNSRVIDMYNRVSLYKSVKYAADEAINSGEDVESFVQTLDSMLPESL